MSAEETVNTSPEQCLEEGKKQLAAGDPAEAVESLQEACALLAEEYGQMAPELAEPYYLYGKALLELARVQSTVLGAGVPVPAESDDTSDDEDGEGESPDPKQASLAAAASSSGAAPGSSTAYEDGAPGSSTANENGAAPGSSNTNENGAAPGSSTTNENGAAPGSSTTSENGAAPGSSTANEDGAPDSGIEGEEDESDLKLAWEVLELARVICQKQSEEEYKLKLSDVQLVLAEVSLEADQSEQAIADLNASLQIRELFLEPHDRRLAEVHFNLGLAHLLSQQPKLAIKHFSSARDVLIKRKEVLDTGLRESGLSEEKSASVREEVADIDNLLPDIETKITDTQEMKRLMEQREFQTEEVSDPAAAGSSDAKKPRTEEQEKASAEQ